MKRAATTSYLIPVRNTTAALQNLVVLSNKQLDTALKCSPIYLPSKMMSKHHSVSETAELSRGRSPNSSVLFSWSTTHRRVVSTVRMCTGLPDEQQTYASEDAVTNTPQLFLVVLSLQYTYAHKEENGLLSL